MKTGALAARGRCISYVDADLDLDPASIPDFLRLAQRASASTSSSGRSATRSRCVHYPRSRRVGSWLYQQLVRVLFRLDVRDTQVGLKLFRREVAEEVLPLLLVKQFAFDLEFLAVARALGYGRIREQPVKLQYRFTGSGVRSVAVLSGADRHGGDLLPAPDPPLLPAQAGAAAGVRADARSYRPRVTLVSPDAGWRWATRTVELVGTVAEAPEARTEALHQAEGEIVAFLGRGSVPAANWLDATVPFLANPRIAAVVTPSHDARAGHGSRAGGGSRSQESWLGGGSHYFRFTPGNLRFVRQFPGSDLVARTERSASRLPEDASSRTASSPHSRRAAGWFSTTPETVVVAPRPPLFRPHLERVAALRVGPAERRAGTRASRLQRHRPRAPPPAGVSARRAGCSRCRAARGWSSGRCSRRATRRHVLLNAAPRRRSASGRFA